MLYYRPFLCRSSGSFNHQTVYRMLCIDYVKRAEYTKFQSPNGVQNALVMYYFLRRLCHVSITKRCTECFEKHKEYIRRCRGFNHQTVYRMLCAASYNVRGCCHCFNHQTVYRMLSISDILGGNRQHVSITKRCTECFFLYSS